MPIAIKMAGKEIASYDTTTDKVAIKLGDDVSINDSAGNVVLNESGGAVTLTADKVVATQGLGGTPAFSAYMGSDQTVSHATSTKLNFDTEEFDTNNNFDTTTYRFTPTVAGYYQIIVVSSLQSPTETHRIISVIWKNSVQYKNGGTCGGAAGTWPSSIASTILYMNGSTDYVEGYVFIAVGSGTGNIIADYSHRSQFSGVLVRAT